MNFLFQPVALRFIADAARSVLLLFSILSLLLISGCTGSPGGTNYSTATTENEGERVRKAVLEIESKDIAPEPASKISSLDGQKTVLAKQFVAVTANPHATAAAYEILAAGGNAIDAAIAAQAVLGLVEPQSSGLGGGGFLLYWDKKNNQLHSYDGRETAPLLADENLFLNPGTQAPLGFFDAVIGGRSVGVPGLIKMLERAHVDHGRTHWSQLFDHAVLLSEQGFEVSERLNKLITFVPKMKDRSDLAEYLFNQHGEPLAIGSSLVNPQYSETLRAIAETGSAAIFASEITDEIVEKVNQDKNHGSLSRADFDRYKVVKREPVCREVFSYRVCGMPPPSSGGTTVLSILGVLDKLQQGSPDTKVQLQTIDSNVEQAHRFVEASRLAFADRNTWVADPDFVEVPVTQLLDADYFLLRAAMINDERAIDSPSTGILLENESAMRQLAYSPEQLSTTHLSIVDQWGNAVSMTTSIEMAFGSRLMAGGFILNNQLTDFSFVPESEDQHKVANRVQGGKRPRSSMAPTMVFDEAGNLMMVVGSPGGKKIIAYVARVLYEVLALGVPLDQSIAAQHVLYAGRGVELEMDASDDFLDQLNALGHQAKKKRHTSGLHAIVKRDEGWFGVADPRREGIALGR